MHDTTSRYSKAELIEFRRKRIETIEYDGAVRSVVCPKCSARVGENCHSQPSFWETPFHSSRKRAAGVR